MKAIIVDDERLALADLSRQLESVGVEVAGQFINPLEGLEAALQADVEVVFLDIEMPGLSGIELAEELLQTRPDQEIVFVTAYNEHAVRAFELNAVDYLLKPVQKDRLAEAVQRVRRRLQSDPTVSSPPPGPVHVRMFGELRLESVTGVPVTPSWRTTKALELFAYLVHHGGGPVSRDALLEVLWPDLDPERAYTHLYTTVYQVRRTLALTAPRIKVESTAQAYRLTPRPLGTDADQWVRDLQKAPPIGPETIALHQQLVERQSQDFLGAYDFSWAEPERHRLRTLWLQQALQVADYWLGVGATTEALAQYYAIMERQAQAEQAHFGLMRCHALLGDRPSVEERYHVLTQMLSEEYGMEPSPHIAAWYADWQRQGGQAGHDGKAERGGS